MRSRIIGYGLAVVFVFITGCEKRDPVVARVGRNEVITLGDFEKSFLGKKSYPELQKMGIREKRDRLDELVDRRIKLMAARDAGLDRDSVVVESVLEMKKRLVAQQLYDVEVLHRIIKESDVREYYARMGKEVVIRKIVIANPVSADSSATEDARERAGSLMERISSGEDFSLLAREYSEDAETAGKGGLVEPMSWTGGLDPVLKTAFSMKVKEVSGPIRTRQGYQILRLEEIRNKERKPLPEVRGEIEQVLQRMKTPELQKAAGDYLDALKQTNGVRFYDKGLGALTDHIKDVQNPVPARLMAAIDGLDDIEKSRVLLSFQGEDFTILSFKDFLKRFPPERALYFSSPQLIKNALDRWLSQRLVFERGLRRRLDKDPEIQSRLREVQDAYMLQVAEKRMAGEERVFSEEEIEAYYREHREEQYTERARVKVQEVMVKDPSTADRVARLARSGGSFDRLVQEYTERLGYKKKNGVIDYFMEGRYGAMGEAAFRMTPGEIRGPIDLGNDQGYSIIKLLDQKPAKVQELDEVRGRVENDLRRSADRERRESWMEEKRSLYGVHVYEEVLESAFAGL